VAVREWLWRYGPAEVSGTVGAVLAATVAAAVAGAATTAYAGAIGEAVAFYAVIVVRDLRTRTGSRRRTLAGLAVEFGPAEVADTLVVRPLAMYLGPLLVGHLAAGVLAGKLAADVVFYALAIVGYELRRTAAARRAARAAATAPPRAESLHGVVPD
jgi:hypothetical protein